MYKKFLIVCVAIFALQTKASQEQHKIVDVHAKLIRMPFTVNGTVFPGSMEGGMHHKVPVQGIYPTPYGEIQDYLRGIYPATEVIAFNVDDHDDYFADVFIDFYHSHEVKVRENLLFLSLIAAYQKTQATKNNGNPKKE